MPFCHRKIDNAVWELTLRCNANCIHCGSSAGKDRSNNLTYEEALSVIKQLVEEKCRVLGLIGGEYFLYPKWKELLLELKKTPINTRVITNGLLLTEENLNFLMEAGVQAIGISIDGATAKTHDAIRRVPGCFDKAFDAAKRARAKHIPTTVITTINRLNIVELKDFRTKLIENKMRSWQVQHANLFGRMQKELSLDDFGYYVVGLFCAQTMRLFKKDVMDLHAMHCLGYYSKTIPCHTPNRFWHGCFAGKDVLGIRSNGDILGCLSLYDDRYIEGNIREKSLHEIRYNKDFCCWNHRLQKYKSLTGFCKECPYGLICLGGCASYDEKQRHCYFEIEQKMEKLKPENGVEKVLYDMTKGRMDKTGRFFLKTGQEITQDYINSLDIDEEHKNQLAILVVDNNE